MTRKMTFLLVLTVVNIAYAATKEERLQALENVALYIPSDDLTEVPDEKVPTPADVREKYNLTVSDLREDILDLAGRYSKSETNEEKRICRKLAVLWIGGYGNTNDLQLLRNIMYDKTDYAQESALSGSIYMLRLSDGFIPHVRDVVSNTNVFSSGLRSLAYRSLHDMSVKEYGSYVDNTNVQERIASFFLERAAVEADRTLYVDRVACELNPSYRHSQQRRDNLARLRPAGLTGEQAEIYNARQRDAQPKEDE